MNDTIVAIATAHGIGSICIVRISGRKALEIVSNISDKKLKPRYATLVNLKSEDKSFIDEAIAIYFKAPNSFTGEDVVELQTHGGTTIGNIVISELLKYGARLAKPGEFSKRAFLNNKISLDKAEAIQAIINTKSQSAAKILARSMKGELSLFVDSLRTELVRTLAYVETAIDYADDDLPPNILTATNNLLEDNIKKIEDIVAISNSRMGLIDGFKVAIIGKPNVGKSSLLNSLLKYERAIISDKAGTTRDRIEEAMQIGTHIVKIIDTAGIRNGADEIEKVGIQHSKAAAKEADVILAVFDSSNILEELDKNILNICKNYKDKKIIYILNKSDLPFKFNYQLQNPIKINSQNITPLLDYLNEYLNSLDTSSLMLSSIRQINLCEEANKRLKNASKNLNEGELELFSYEINLAIESLSLITRPFSRSEILDEMFSNFCLGK